MASSPKVPDPNSAAVAGALAQAGTFPFQQYIDYLAQTGGSANIVGTNYNFTGLGNAQQNAALSGAGSLNNRTDFFIVFNKLTRQ